MPPKSNYIMVRRIITKAMMLVWNGWCKNAHARTSSGDACSPLAQDAVTFSLYGALARANAEAEGNTRDLFSAVQLVTQQLSGLAPQYYNDNVPDTKAQVCAVLGDTQQLLNKLHEESFDILPKNQQLLPAMCGANMMSPVIDTVPVKRELKEYSNPKYSDVTLDE